MNQSENKVSSINKNIFFKEFTFSRNEFQDHNSSMEYELADNIVWLDSIFFIYQIKERKNVDKSNDYEKWFKKKVTGKAVKQIKDTLSYLKKYEKISLQNEKGHYFNLSDAKNTTPEKIIIYSPDQSFPKPLRNRKIHNSKSVGDIHLFHIDDYIMVCHLLITPMEINQYFKFRLIREMDF